MGELESDFPSGCSSFSALELPCLCSSGGGRLIQSLADSFRSSRRFTCPCSRLFSFPIMLPGVVTTLQVCLPRAPALRQVLEAMLAEGALESHSILVLAFHLSLSLVDGSSDRLDAGVRFLSPGRLCLSLRSC